MAKKMTTCSDVERVMTPFVDGELDAGEQRRVERHLAQCPGCRTRSTAERAARDLVRDRVAALHEVAPAGLRARCAASMRAAAVPVTTPRRAAAVPVATPRRAGAVRWVPAGAVVALTAALAWVLLAGQDERLTKAFLAQLALDHDRCFRVHEVSDPDFGHAEATDLLIDDGWNVAVPRESSELDLVEARRCLYDDGDMVHLLCRWRGYPVSLFMVPGRSGRDRTLEIMGRHAVTWGDRDDTYVLMAKGVPADLGQMAAYVRRFTD